MMPTTRQGTGRLASLLAVTFLSACDIPTALPRWDTTFVVEAASIGVDVDELLPEGVRVVNNGTAFALDIPAVTSVDSLGSLCAQCRAVSGVFAPKPAFVGSFTDTLALPADVRGGVITSGMINLAITNGMSFDPLRQGAARGSMVITIRSGNTTLGSTTINGETTPFAPGSTLPVSILLQPGTLNSQLVATLTLNSPAGPATQINSSDRITITAAPVNVIARSARILVDNEPVTADPIRVDLSDIDNFVRDNAKSGALRLTFTNPFGVSGTLTLRITGGDAPIVKQVVIANATTSSVEVPLDRAELLSIFNDVEFTLTGSLSRSGEIDVLPTESLSVAAQLMLIIGPEE